MKTSLLKTLDYSVLQQCMHCGLCLPTCPTYDATKLERHSPRGRIALMRAVADDRLEVTKAFGDEMYFCLGCLACETACPAGVNYTTLFETARASVEEAGVWPISERTFWRALLLRGLFRWPWGLRAAGRLLWIFQASGLQSFFRRLGLTKLLPGHLRRLEPQTPPIATDDSDTLIGPVEHPAHPQYRVGLLTGCMQDLVYAHVNRDTADVLLAAGCSVYTPREQSCCGSLHGHNGDTTSARDLARRLIDLFAPLPLDAIITNAAGCGSHLKHYAQLLANDPDYAAKAQAWSEKVKDIHEFLAALQTSKSAIRSSKSETNSKDSISSSAPETSNEKPATAESVTVTYHDACHLCHAQKISQAPRALLKAEPGLSLIELREASWCCGSAGIYNLTHPELSEALLARKIACLQETGASVVAAANPGCQLQLERGLRKAGIAMEVVHPVSLLARALRPSPEQSQPPAPPEPHSPPAKASSH